MFLKRLGRVPLMVALTAFSMPNDLTIRRVVGVVDLAAKCPAVWTLRCDVFAVAQ